MSYLGHSFLMWVDHSCKMIFRRKKVKQAIKKNEQHQLGALSLKELNKMQGFVQVGFSIGSKPRVFHCSFRHAWNYDWPNGGNYLRKSLGKWGQREEITGLYHHCIIMQELNSLWVWKICFLCTHYFLQRYSHVCCNKVDIHVQFF